MIRAIRNGKMFAVEKNKNKIQPTCQAEVEELAV